MKKVVIIGGGIAGLSAGIYAQRNGFETEIFEKNAVAGGECTGWNRKGYHIDNCIHWLIGSDKKSKMNQIWRDLGVLSDEIPVYFEPYFYMLDKDGKQLHFWSDLEKARNEFLETAPEDTEEINKFFDAVKCAESMQIPCEKSIAEMNFVEYMKFGMGMADIAKVTKEYGNETVEEITHRFHNPLVREMMTKYFSKEYMAFTLIVSCSFLTSQTGGLPQGGSVGMVERMVKQYEKLGGKLHLCTEVNKILTQKHDRNNIATGIQIADGKLIKADYVICATDTDVTFHRLLDSTYMDKALCSCYSSSEGYKTITMFHAAFGVEADADEGVPSGSVMFDCEPFHIATKEEHYMAIRKYDYDETLFPSGKHVIQCNILMDEEDYLYWKELYRDKESYQKEKERIAGKLQERIEKKYPQLKGKLVFLETYTPVTFERYCSAYKGAYMSFFGQKGCKSIYLKNTIKGLNNVLISSQWLQLNGGLPIAATSGKFAVQALMKKEKRKFV